MAGMGKLRPRWDADGPLTVTAGPSLSAYPLALPARMRCSRTISVDRLKPFLGSTSHRLRAGPVSDQGQEGEHEAELLNRRLVRGVTHYLARWRGHTSAADDEWLRAEELGHCPEKVADSEYDAAAAPRRRAARRGDPGAGPAAVDPAVAAGPTRPVAPRPAGFGPGWRSPSRQRLWVASQARRWCGG